MKKIGIMLSLWVGMSVAVYAKDVVVLLHGLARSSDSMSKLEKALKEEGYEVLNIAYPSRKHTVDKLAEMVREQIVKEIDDIDKIHFVTHSMGGIIVRYIQKEEPLENIGRVVMLSPPNQGSEVVDKLGHLKMFKWLNGPAGLQLGTAEKGLVDELGPADFELGIITGDRSINWILSSMIPGEDDGKVSRDSAKVEGMDAYKVVHATHPLIMKNKKVIEHVKFFLKFGTFVSP